MEWRYSSRERDSGAAREDLETESEIEIGKGRGREAGTPTLALCRIEEGNQAGLRRGPLKQTQN